MVAVELGEILGHLALAEHVVERVVDSLRRMPKREAASRSMVSITRRPGSAGRSDVAQLAAASASLASICGAQVFSSSRSASCSVYWNCVRVGAAADLDVLRRLQEEPGRPDRLASLGRRRVMIWSAVALRSLARLQRDEQVALVAGRRCRPIAMPTLATSGSCLHDRASASCSCCMAWRRKRPARLRTCRERSRCPAAGKKPFGMMTYR